MPNIIQEIPVKIPCEQGKGNPKRIEQMRAVMRIERSTIEVEARSITMDTKTAYALLRAIEESNRLAKENLSYNSNRSDIVEAFIKKLRSTF